MDDQKEQNLIRGAKRGDKKAIAALYDHHYRAVFNYIYYRVSDQQSAEDLSAEVFIRMINKIPSYKDRGRPFLAWLYTIARNLVIDHYRAGEKREELPIKENLLEHPSLAPDQQIQVRQQEDCFRKVLDKLPENQRQLLIFRFINGFSTPEIVDLLEKSDRAIRSLQHRALRSLERALSEENCL
jgi:RNA polymerase sigma-70 factor (ECF subfamily)